MNKQVFKTQKLTTNGEIVKVDQNNMQQMGKF